MSVRCLDCGEYRRKWEGKEGFDQDKTVAERILTKLENEVDRIRAGIMTREGNGTLEALMRAGYTDDSSRARLDGRLVNVAKEKQVSRSRNLPPHTT